MKSFYFLIVPVLIYPSVALSAIEYFHCEKRIDSYWKFDTEAISNKEITPYIKPKVRMRQMGEVTEFGNVEMTDEWFKVTMGIDFVRFFNRKGRTSFVRANDIFFGTQNVDAECKSVSEIEGEDLSKFFLTNVELEKERTKEKSKGAAPSKNWN